MPHSPSHVIPVALPAQSAIASAYAPVHLADAFAVDLPPGASGDPELLARFIFAQQAPWVQGLMAVRDAIVARFGLKTSRQLNAMAGEGRPPRVGIFRIYSSSATEIVLGEDDTHLDFRASVLCIPAATPGAARQLVLSTVVQCHNALGRAYIAVIAPFHRQVVQSSLRRAARRGWPPL